MTYFIPFKTPSFQVLIILSLQKQTAVIFKIIILNMFLMFKPSQVQGIARSLSSSATQRSTLMC